MRTREKQALLERLTRIKKITSQGAAERVDANKRASEPIVGELRQLGFDVEWIAELPHRVRNYDAAIPTLLKWLRVTNNRAVKASLVRVLSIPSLEGVDKIFAAEYRSTKGLPSLRDVTGYDSLDEAMANGIAVEATKELFDAIDSETLREALANGLEIVATDSIADELLEFAQAKSLGMSRKFITSALGKIKGKRSVAALMSLVQEPALRPFAIKALGQLRAQEATEVISRFVDAETPEVAKAAREALKRLSVTRQ